MRSAVVFVNLVIILQACDTSVQVASCLPSTPSLKQRGSAGGASRNPSLLYTESGRARSFPITGSLPARASAKSLHSSRTCSSPGLLIPQEQTSTSASQSSLPKSSLDQPARERWCRRIRFSLSCLLCKEFVSVCTSISPHSLRAERVEMASCCLGMLNKFRTRRPRN